VFEQAGAVVLAISPQDVDSHERFAEQEGFTFPLLADVDQAVGAAYGIGGGRIYRRSVFIVDEDGILRWKNVKLVGATWKTAKDLGKVLATL
jgi:thioredoxin-dependent peroxiredoxin